MATAPPLAIGQMIKIAEGKHQGEAGVLIEQKRMKYLVQLLGEKSDQQVYLLPSNLKPMYLSDSPKTKVSISSNRVPDAPQDHLSISPTPSTVSSITTPTVGSQISAPDGSSFRKYRAGPIEPGHGVRIVGGTYKGLRGYVVERQRVKLLVRLEHTEEEIFLMPSNLGPWERSSALAVLKQRRGHKELGSPEKQQPTERAREASPLKKFWSPVKEGGDGDNATSLHSRGSASSGLELMFSHTSDLGGVKILSHDDKSSDSLTESTDPSILAQQRVNKMKASGSRTRQHVVSPNRLGSPLRRRRARVASPSPEHQSHTDEKSTTSSTPSDRSLFKRKGYETFKPIPISTNSTVSSTDPSAETTSEPSSKNTRNTVDHLQAHKERQQSRQQTQEKTKLHTPVAKRHDPSPLHLEGSDNTSINRSIFRRKKSPLASRRPIGISTGQRDSTASAPSSRPHGISTGAMTNTSMKQKPLTPKTSTPKAATPKANTPKNSTPKSSTLGDRENHRSTTPKSSRTTSGMNEVVSTPRMALREKFTFKNIHKTPTPKKKTDTPTRTRLQEAARHEAPMRSRPQEETSKPTLSPPSEPLPPEEIKRSLSPLMLRRRSMSRARRDAAIQQTGSPTVLKSFSLSPRLNARRRGSRLKAAHALKEGEPTRPAEKAAKKEKSSETPRKGNKVQTPKAETNKKADPQKPKFQKSDAESKANKRSENRALMRHARKCNGRKQQARDPDESSFSSEETKSTRERNDLQEAPGPNESSSGFDGTQDQSSQALDLMRNAPVIMKSKNDRRRHHHVREPDDSPSVVDGNKPQANEALEQACSWSFTTTASTEALLRKYSEASSRPIPAKTISVVSTPVIEEVENVEPFQPKVSTQTIALRSTVAPAVEEPEFVVNVPEKRVQKIAQNLEKPPVSPTFLNAESNIEIPPDGEEVVGDDPEEDRIIAKYNQILQRRMNASKKLKEAKQASEGEIKKVGSFFVSDDEESDVFSEEQQKARRQQKGHRTAKANRVSAIEDRQQADQAREDTERGKEGRSNIFDEHSFTAKTQQTRQPEQVSSNGDGMVEFAGTQARPMNNGEQELTPQMQQQEGNTLPDSSKHGFGVLSANNGFKRSYSGQHQPSQSQQQTIGGDHENIQPTPDPVPTLPSRRQHNAPTSNDKNTQSFQTKPFPEPTQARLSREIQAVSPTAPEPNHSNLDQHQAQMIASSSYDIALTSADLATESPPSESPPSRAFFDGGVLTTNSSSPASKSSANIGTTRYALTFEEEFSIGSTSEASRQQEPAPDIPEPPLSTKALRAQQEVRRKSFEGQQEARRLFFDEQRKTPRSSPRDATNSSTAMFTDPHEARRLFFDEQRRTPRSSPCDTTNTSTAIFTASQFVGEQQQEAYRASMEPQLFTQKLFSLSLEPPPPPPPGQPTPRSRAKNKPEPSPPAPPMTPRTPGGTRRPAFAEAPATSPRNSHPQSIITNPHAQSYFAELSTTPRNSNIHQGSLRHVLGEPSPTSRTPRTPNGTPNILVDPSPRASSPSMRSSPKIGYGSPMGRNSPVNSRYGTSFGYGSESVCDLVSQHSSSAGETTLDGESLEDIPSAPSSAVSREEQQRKNRTLFQKSFWEATNSRSSSGKKTSLAKQISALSKNAPSPLQEVTSPSSNNNKSQERRSSRIASSPISIITKQSFAPQSTLLASSLNKKGKTLDKCLHKKSPEPFEMMSSSISSPAKGKKPAFKSGNTSRKKQNNPVGASWQEILQIPTRTLTRKDAVALQQSPSLSRCTLCSRSFRPKDVIRTLPCQHNFHAVCIDPYLFLQAECPKCKHPAVVQEL